jgi:histidyl-tRNA synthetase
MALIEPRTLKGFRDYLPPAAVPREELVDKARKVYRSFGFLPIDTPALEYEEILTGKGGEESDKQLYRFEDPGGRKVALRFDLTVPLARFVAQHSHELGLPFKRYHIATVWRGENTQRGRYREFMQCDFDTIGSESIASDVETALVIHELMRAIGFEDFTIKVNNRRVLTGLLESLDLAEKSGPVLRALDKLPKVGPEKVTEEMALAGVSAKQAGEILRLASVSGTNEAMLAQLEPLVGASDRGRDGLAKLATLLESARAAGVPENRIQLDVSIARGLDYYTGAVFETFLGAVPGIGSVCSGGRYDDLASLYTKERLPGVGASLGLDRLLAAMEELKLLPERPAVAPLFLANFSETRLADYFALASKLRAHGIGVEFYPDAKKLGAQLKYADRRGFRWALIVGDDEWASNTGQLKELARGTFATVPLRDAGGDLSSELLRALAR